MDFSWLSDIFGKLLGIFSPLKSIQHWKIWAEMKAWYDRFKKWRDWYRDHILKPFQAEQKALAQLRDKFVMPVIKLIDHIRQLSQVIGIFNKGLANKLNYQFLKIETGLLSPFNAASNRINTIAGMFGGFLTGLGYFDRDTVLNSIWRDASLVKQILYNPFGKTMPAAKLPAAPTMQDRLDWTSQYIKTDSGPYAQAVDDAVLKFQQLKAGG